MPHHDPPLRRLRFEGHIAGIGSGSGVRVVCGWWPRSSEPGLGSFADAMVALPDGHRVLLAPDADVARLLAATYTFDEIRIEPFDVAGDPDRTWRVRSPSLTLDVEVGARTWLGSLLRAVPRRVGTAPAWCAVTDPVARVVLRGVRTRGAVGERRREWYGATGHRAITAASGRFDDLDLGALAPVTPSPGFGFSSTPPRPSVTAVTTTIELPADVAVVGRTPGTP